MAEYIEREATLYRMKVDIAPPFKVVAEMPAADVAPVRHGRWIKIGYSCGDNEYECSVCHETEWRTSAIRLKYCPCCGARMDGGEPDA